MNLRYVIILIFISYPFNVLANEKIAYFDIDFVLNNTIKGKSIIENLNNLNKKNLNDLKTKEKELDDEKNEINKLQETLPSDELNKKINNFKNKVKIYQNDKDLKIKNLKQLKNKEINIFIKEISPIIEEYMKENLISLLIDKNSIFIANQKYDITDEIVELIDKKLKND